MGWNRLFGRDARARRRPRLESLEARTLLSVAPAVVPALTAPVVAGAVVPAGATDYDAILGASATRSQYKVDGTGQSVAVIDTGVNYTNEDLGGAFGPGHKVVAGFDFADNSPDPMAVDNHGTSVAGLIAGSDPATPGIAPGADIVALRVFDNSGGSSFSNVAKALQWVVTNHSTYNITVVNMSISDGNNYTSNWFAQDGGVGEQITDLIGQLAALDIPVVAAAGNGYVGQQGMGFTAIVPQTISVTSAMPSGTSLASDAQRLGSGLGGVSATDIAAPGVGDYAPVNGSSFAGVTGTSFAAPLVSGSLVILQQIYQQRFGTLPTVAQLDGWIQAGATPITDASSGITIGEINLARAAALIPAPAPAVTPTPTPPPTNPPPPPPTPAPTPNSTTSPAPTPPPSGGAAGSTNGGSTGTDNSGSGGSTTPPVTTPVPTVATEVYLNGDDLGSVNSSQADGGWSAFLSLFTGGITSIQAWNSSASTSTTANPFQGATFTSIQQWTSPPTSDATVDPTPSPTPSPTPTPAASHLSPQQAHGKVRIPLAGLHVKPSASTHHMARAWNAGFAGHRHHR